MFISSLTRLISATLALLIFFQPFMLLASDDALKTVALFSKDQNQHTGIVISDLQGAIGNKGCCRIIDTNLVNDVASYNDAILKSNEDEQDASLTRAKELYLNFKYNEAKPYLDQIIASYGTLSPSAYGSRLSDAIVLRIFVAKALKEEGMIESLATDLIKVNPYFEADEMKFPPSIATKINAAKNAVLLSSLGKIKVVSSPTAVEVYINGIAQGVSPYTFENLPQGEYLITLKANHYSEFSKVVSVKPGAEVKVDGKLKWNEGVEKSSDSSILYGARLASLVRAEKLVLIDVNGEGTLITARMVDSHFSVGQRPYSVKFSESIGTVDKELYAKKIEQLAEKLAQESSYDLVGADAFRANVTKDTSPEFFANLKKPIYKRPLFWGATAAVLGGLAAGLVLGFSGGGSSNTGTLNVNFKAQNGR